MRTADRFPPTTTRVELHTAPQLNQAIRERSDTEVIRLEKASPGELTARLQQLDTEWDVERLLQTNASILCLVGLTLGARVNRRFLLLPAAAFFFPHAACPPRLVSTDPAVPPPRCSYKARNRARTLRAQGDEGDFNQVPGLAEGTPGERVRAVLRAVDA